MQIEQLEILDFLRARPPFADLPEEVLQRTAAAVDVRYYKAGEGIVAFGEPAAFWHVVRSGAVEVFRRNGTLYNRLTEGGYFGEFGLLRNGRVRFPATALEDALIYLIPAAVFTSTRVSPTTSRSRTAPACARWCRAGRSPTTCFRPPSTPWWGAPR